MVKCQIKAGRIPKRRNIILINIPPIPTSTTRMKNGCAGYPACPNPQSKELRKTAKNIDLVCFCKNGIKNSLDIPSSITAGKSPNKRTPIHGI